MDASGEADTRNRTFAEQLKGGGLLRSHRCRLEGSIMSAEEIDQPFDTIESAQEFMNVLASTVLDVMKELSDARRQAEREGEERKARAIDLAVFKLKTLGCYVHKSRRALNDLRIIRRLILNERLTVENIIATL